MPASVMQMRALDRAHDVVDRQRAAVVEAHAGAELETPALRAGLGPLGGQPGHQLELLVAPHQGLVDLAVHHVGHGLVLRVRVHRLRVALACPAQGLRSGCERQQERGGERPRADRRVHRDSGAGGRRRTGQTQAACRTSGASTGGQAGA
jgi:hypothetical protein